jgi:hypothetical protein
MKPERSYRSAHHAATAMAARATGTDLILQFAPQARLHAGRPERCFDRESVAGAK